MGGDLGRVYGADGAVHGTHYFMSSCISCVTPCNRLCMRSCSQS